LRLTRGNRQVVRLDVRTPKGHFEVKRAQPQLCRHGFPMPEELVTLTITDHKTGARTFRKVWRPVENAACPDA